jgi:hypothetical protein
MGDGPRGGGPVNRSVGPAGAQSIGRSVPVPRHATQRRSYRPTARSAGSSPRHTFSVTIASPR